ncbi:hypothetical protein K8I28_17145 [bacterium]|nr:hypothetical protein [bacterium]
MQFRTFIFLLLALLIATSAYARFQEIVDRGPVKPEYNPTIDVIQTENRLHDVGNIWLTITNYGYFGNDGSDRDGFLEDPCTGEWSPQAEFPANSGIQYLFMGAMWIGAIIQEEGFEYARVSTGVEGWLASANDPYLGREFFPGHEPGNGIVERSSRQNAYNCLGEFITSDEAVSEQDFISSYTDTHRVSPLGSELSTPRDGPHVPLGIKVTQKSYAWSYNYARDFIIIDYEIENIANNFLKNLFVGLYVDADVGHVSESGNNRAQDDICGFKTSYQYQPQGSNQEYTLTINTAYISDNDGRPRNVNSGNDFSGPGVTGTRVVRAPNPKLRTSFNWWISNTDANNDFGPAWEDDHSPGNWTGTLGTPEDDERKYFVLSNREFDYDQIRVNDPAYISGNSQEFVNRFTNEVLEAHDWRIPDAGNADDLANGFDTRYLLSWGPLGVFDHIDEGGNRIYRLNPGEKFSMTIAYVAGENFHDRQHPQPSSEQIDYELFDFSDFQYNADWAAKVYDNPMIDTNGDGWFGEDVGVDGIYSDSIGDTLRWINWNNELFTAVYTEPDSGELDGVFQLEEDLAPRPIQYDYTYNNELFDQGDGEPDFRGPPPPEVPILTSSSDTKNVYLKWGKFPSESEEYQDPFSRLQDFEGYRIYVSNTGLETEFSLVAEYDRIDFAYYSERDSLMSIPIATTQPDTLPEIMTNTLGVTGFLRPVGPNIGLASLVDPDVDSMYVFDIGETNPMIPRYYTVTAFDYGDPFSGTEPLETAKSANMLYLAPSGTDRKKPGVVPNPYRADMDYTQQHMQLIYDVDTTFVAWENRNDGTPNYFPQTDRRMYFYNLPKKCYIRIFTVSGDLVTLIDHNISGNRISNWVSDHAEVWDLNSRNQQQVVSGLYFFSVEDRTAGNEGHIDVGKFVIIR